MAELDLDKLEALAKSADRAWKDWAGDVLALITRIRELEAEVDQYIGDLKHARDGWDAAEARAERLETAIHFNCHILQQVRDILHAHKPINNETRLSIRASIDGVIRRLSVALARKREPDDD